MHIVCTIYTAGCTKCAAYNKPKHNRFIIHTGPWTNRYSDGQTDTHMYNTHFMQIQYSALHHQKEFCEHKHTAGHCIIGLKFGTASSERTPPDASKLRKCPVSGARRVGVDASSSGYRMQSGDDAQLCIQSREGLDSVDRKHESMVATSSHRPSSRSHDESDCATSNAPAENDQR